MSQSPWRVAAASVRGTGHEKAGLPCQDAHQWITLEEGVLLVAVADGAGSAPLADVGAALAVRRALDSATQQFSRLPPPGRSDAAAWEGLLAQAAADARAALEAEAHARSVSMGELATTLIVAMAGRDGLAAMQIGDGAVIIADGAESLFCVTRSVPGEYLNETIFLTSSEALASVRPVVWRGRLSHLAVISDGLQMAALRMPMAEPHPGFFKPLFRFLSQQADPGAAQAALSAFLGSARLRERTDDDVTLVQASLMA